MIFYFLACEFLQCYHYKDGNPHYTPCLLVEHMLFLLRLHLQGCLLHHNYPLEADYSCHANLHNELSPHHNFTQNVASMHCASLHNDYLYHISSHNDCSYHVSLHIDYRYCASFYDDYPHQAYLIMQ